MWRTKPRTAAILRALRTLQLNEGATFLDDGTHAPVGKLRERIKHYARVEKRRGSCKRYITQLVEQSVTVWRVE